MTHDLIDRLTVAGLAIALAASLADAVQAAKPGTFSGSPTLTQAAQRLPRGWRYIGDRRQMTPRPGTHRATR